jgi:hypothetical protein
VLLRVEQISQEEGVGMSFQSEVVTSMLIHEVVKIADIESVEFDCLEDSSVDCFSVVLGIAIHQQVILVHHAVIGIRIIIVKSEFLDSCKAIETPELIIVCCVNNPVEALFIIVDLFLFASKDSL